MKITRDNYEMVFVDYIEGNLNEQELKELEKFLLQNPDLKEELALFNETKLEANEISFKDKHILKKPSEYTDIKYFEHLCIANFESDITTEEKHELEKLLQKNIANQKDFELFKKSFLKPDLLIEFPNKNQLKRKSIFPNYRRIIYFSAAAAASGILLWIGLNFINRFDEKLLGLTAYNSNYNIKTNREYIQPKQKITIINHSNTIVKSVDNKDNKNKITNDSTNIATQIILISAIKPDLSQNDFTKFYNDLKKNENDIVLANIQKALSETRNQQLNNDNEPESPVRKYFETKLKENVLKQDKKQKITFLSVVKAIIKGYNSLTESNVSLEEKIDKQGKLKAVALNTGNYTISYEK